MTHIENIIGKLDLDRGSLFKSDFSFVFSERIYTTLKKEFNLYAAFCIDEKPLLLFFNNPETQFEKELHKWIWNYNQSAVAIIVKGNQVDIFNAFSFNKESELLNILDTSENLYTHFNYLQLITGETWETYKDKFLNQNRVDYKLLQDLQLVREIAVERLQKKGLKDEAYGIVNALIGRLLFIRYLIDRDVKIHFEDYKEGKLTKENLNKILGSKEETFKLFDHLRRFNGDLFPFGDRNKKENAIDERDVIDADLLKDFIRLFEGTDINGQTSLFQFYDFSILPVEFISNVYEQFIGSDKQKQQGAYYTPLFLVNYILNRTVSKHFAENKNINTCRVLDPSCGSGIFLVETLRKIIGRYQVLNPNYNDNPKQYQEALKQLVYDNIYGVDKDDNAIDVAIFSLYITLLDYQTPADISDFKLPPLRNKNFFHADFFNEEHAFNNQLKSVEFDFIIGNPPWGTLEDNQIYMDYCKKREKEEKSTIKISNKEAAQAFLIRVSDFAQSNPQIALIVTSKVLYNLQANVFRQYFVKHFFIDEILELSAVRRDVFSNISENKSEKRAIAPASIIFYKWANHENTKEHTVKHLSIKPNLFFKLLKIIVLEKHDIKEVSQGLFLENDWLFKLLVYGNVLDFQLMTKILKGYPNVNDVIRDRDLFFGQGIDVSQGTEDIPTHLIGRPFVDAKRKMLEKFFVRIDKNYTWEKAKASRPRSEITYQPPYLLLKKGLASDFTAVSAVCNEEIVFMQTITAIKGEEDDISTLKILSSLFNSNLFAYYILMKGSSIGIEREQAHNEDEKFTMPYVFSENILNNVIELEEHKKLIYSDTNLFDNILEEKDKQLTEQLNQSIFDAFKFNEEERSLIDYAQNVSIPLLKEGEKSKVLNKIKEKDRSLETYAKIFIDYFKPRFNNNFGVEIYQTPYCIAMRFYNTNDKIEKPIVFKDKSINNLLEWTYQLGIEKVMDKLFIQKDIRGFEKDAFYIIKPNEYKCWHKAVAYLDAYEFSQVIEDL
jgi:N-6 DNA Methylase